MPEQAEPVPQGAAPWWSRASQQPRGNGGFVAHTPDPTRYHDPDSAQDGRIPGSMVGAVMIPRARPNGTSRGFDHNKPGVVQVDPAYPDSFILDTAKLRSETLETVTQQFTGQLGGGREDEASQASMHDAFKALAVAVATDPSATAADTPAEPSPPSVVRPLRSVIRANPPAVAPTTQEVTTETEAPPAGQPVADDPYATPPEEQPELTEEQQALAELRDIDANAAGPRLDDSGEDSILPASPKPKARSVVRAKVPTSAADLPDQPRQDKAVTSGPRQVSVIKTPAKKRQSKAVTAAGTEKEVNMGQSQLTEETAKALLAALKNGQVADTAKSVVKQPERSLPPTPPAQMAQQPQAPQGAVLGLSAIDTGPSKPRCQVIFDYGKHAGTLSTRYHAVSEGNGCLVLIYDTRYEEGDQYIPPDRGDEMITVHVVQPGKEKARKTYRVASVGLQFNIGCLDAIILVIEEAASMPPPPTDEEPI